MPGSASVTRRTKRSRLARRRVCIRVSATAAASSSAGSSVTIIGVSSVQTGPPSDAGMRSKASSSAQTAVVTQTASAVPATGRRMAASTSGSVT